MRRSSWWTATILLLSGCGAKERPAAAKSSGAHELPYVSRGITYRLPPGMGITESTRHPGRILIYDSSPADAWLFIEQPMEARPGKGGMKVAVGAVTAALREGYIDAYGAKGVSPLAWSRFGPNEFSGITITKSETTEILRGFIIVGSRCMQIKMSLPPDTGKGQAEMRRLRLGVLANIEPKSIEGVVVPKWTDEPPKGGTGSKKKTP